MEKNFERIAEIFKALSNPIRLKILFYLAQNKCNVTNLENVLNISQSRVSQHLRVLRLCGIIKPKRNGKQICYDIANPDVRKLILSFFGEK